jgi:hypothetical protein
VPTRVRTHRASMSEEPKPSYGKGASRRVGLSLMSRLATRGSDPIDQATIRGYVLRRLRRGEKKRYVQEGEPSYILVGAPSPWLNP